MKMYSFFYLEQCQHFKIQNLKNFNISKHTWIL